MGDLPISDSEFQHHDRLESNSPVLEKYTCDHAHDALQTFESIEAHLKSLDSRVQSLSQEVNAARENARPILSTVQKSRETSNSENLNWAKREQQRLDEEVKRIGVEYKGLVEESLELRCQVDMGDPKVMRHINVEEDTVGVLRVKLEELREIVKRTGELVDAVEG